MSLLDRYVGRIMLGAFGASLLFFLFLTILLDLLNNLPRYAERAAGQGLGGFDLALYLAGYYCKLLPVLFVTMTPFVTVIACMFAVARLQTANEIVPMLFVGRSIQRILRPILLCGAGAALAMGVCWQWVVPHVGASIAADESFLRFGTATQKNLVHETFGEVRQSLYVREYDPIEKRMVGVRMLLEGDLTADNTLVSAGSAVWDGGRRDWRLVDGLVVHRIEGRLESQPQPWLGRPDLEPAVLLQRGREDIDPDTQSYTDLLETIRLRPNRADVRLALHRHMTFPLANLLLLLLALPLAVWFERGSRIERILMAIALCGAYMLFDLVCQSLGQRGYLHPIVAAWAPTIVFGALGVVLFGSAKT